MRLFLLACAGGALGSGARYLTYVAAAYWPGTAFPWATLTVNVVGSFAMGILIELILLRYEGSLELRTFLATGILGGFTTFSAFSLDAVRLYEGGEAGAAVIYVLASVVLSILACFAGLAITRAALS